MAKGALAAGLQQRSGSATQLGLGIAQIGQNFGRAMERKMVREQEAQKEFTEKRELFKKEQQDLYDTIAYDDQFEDTGLTDVDEAGQKFADTLRSEYEMNNQMYEMGYIDESELRKRNARMKGQVKHLQDGVYSKITAFKKKYDELEANGSESEADQLKMQMMEGMMKNVSFGVDASGNVELRTPGTGEVAAGPDGKVDLGKATRIPLSKFNDLLANEEGVNLNTLTSNITALEGSGDIYRAGSREYTRYTGFDGEGGRELSDQQEQLMSTAIAGLSQNEKIDALSRLGGVYTDAAEFEKLSADEKKDAVLLDSSVVLGYDGDLEKDIDDKLKRGLNNKLMNELVAKESSKPYDDPLARAAGIKEINKVPLTKPAEVIRKTKDEQRDMLGIENYATSTGGIEMDYIAVESEDSDIKRQLFNDINAQVGNELEGGLRADALSNIKYLSDFREKIVEEDGTITGGYTEVSFGVDVRIPVYQQDANGNFILDSEGKKQQATETDSSGYNTVPAFKTVSKIFKYEPLNMRDYNAILTKTGRNPLNARDWQKIMDARIADKLKNGKYNGYSPKKED